MALAGGERVAKKRCLDAAERERIVSALLRLGATEVEDEQGKVTAWRLTDGSRMRKKSLREALSKQQKISDGTFRRAEKIKGDWPVPEQLVDGGWIFFRERKNNMTRQTEIDFSTCMYKHVGLLFPPDF